MRTFQHHLEEKLKENGFREIYDEEHQLLEMALKIVEPVWKTHLPINHKKLVYSILGVSFKNHEKTRNFFDIFYVSLYFSLYLFD